MKFIVIKSPAQLIKKYKRMRLPQLIRISIRRRIIRKEKENVKRTLKNKQIIIQSIQIIGYNIK